MRLLQRLCVLRVCRGVSGFYSILSVQSRKGSRLWESRTLRLSEARVVSRIQWMVCIGHMLWSDQGVRAAAPGSVRKVPWILNFRWWACQCVKISIKPNFVLLRWIGSDVCATGQHTINFRACKSIARVEWKERGASVWGEIRGTNHTYVCMHVYMMNERKNQKYRFWYVTSWSQFWSSKMQDSFSRAAHSS